MYTFEICGKAFLWHQVRCFMGLLFLIGQHLEEASIIDYLLDLSLHENGELGRPSYDLADEFPLVLVDTGYPSNTFQWKLEEYFGNDPIFNAKKFFLNTLDLWKKYTIKATMIETLVRDVKYFQESKKVNQHSRLTPGKEKEEKEEDSLGHLTNKNQTTSNMKEDREYEYENNSIVNYVVPDSISKIESDDRFKRVLDNISKGTLCSGSKNVQEAKYVLIHKRQRCESITKVRQKFLEKQQKRLENKIKKNKVNHNSEENGSIEKQEEKN